jgi:hypothetical protein
MTSIGIYFSHAGVQCRTQCHVAFVVVVVVVVVVDLKFGRVLGDDRLDYRLVPPRIRNDCMEFEYSARAKFESGKATEKMRQVKWK